MHSESAAEFTLGQLLASDPQHSAQGPSGAGQRISPAAHGGNVVMVVVVVDVVVDVVVGAGSAQRGTAPLGSQKPLQQVKSSEQLLVFSKHASQ